MRTHPNLMMFYIRAATPQPRSYYLAAGLAVLIWGYQPAPAVESYLATCSPLNTQSNLPYQQPTTWTPHPKYKYVHAIILLCSK